MALTVRGNCSTGMVQRVRSPNTRMKRLTTVARTGRRIKRSVKPPMNAPSLFVSRMRVGVVRDLDRVIDLQERPVAQLELPGGYYLLPIFDAAQHRDLVAARIAGGNEGLARGSNRLAVGILGRIIDE